MRRPLLLSALTMVACFSCGDPDTSMIGQLLIAPAVNPEVGILIEVNNLNVTMTDETTVLGTGNGYVFETNNDFQTFQIGGPYSNDLTNIALMTDDVIVSYAIAYGSYGNPLTIARTPNKGGSWQEELFPPIGDGMGSYETLKIQFTSANEGFLLAINSSYSTPSNAVVFKVNFDQVEAEEVGRITGFVPAEMKFLDANVGYMLLHSYLLNNNLQNTFISKTENGGVTWSTPTVVSPTTRLLLWEVIGATQVMIYEANSSLTYLSTNSGSSWTQVSDDIHMTDATFLDTATGYSISLNGTILKTINGGATWNEVGFIVPPNYLNDFDKIHFYNESTGIVHGNNSLYRTNDGGKTWKILIFPFEYVTGP
ncbi:MAG: hypothetical protein JNK10_11390 [Cyclobacteriaceae bacterium]|nr:hypothetical protein [Cyclobacteriaceae bacterium]